MSNKNSASEDDIGKLHNLISKLHNLKASSMLKVIEELIDAGTDPVMIAEIINTKDLVPMQKWVEYNQVGCMVAADDEVSELSKRLKKLRDAHAGKVVDFIQKEAV